MARPTKSIEVIDMNDESIDQPKVANAMALMQADAAGAELALTEQKARVQAVAIKLKYEGSLSPDALENGARDAIRRINLGVFELGGYLLMLREACEHSAFLPALERLELEPRVAQQYMQITNRFANTKTSSHLVGLGKSKLMELLVLDHDQIEELTELGQTGELELDKVVTMSVRELRAALREAKAEKEAADRLVDAKNKQIDKLQLIKTAPVDEQMARTLEELAKRANAALGTVRGGLRLGFEAVAAFENAGENSHRGVMKGYLDDLQRELDILRADYFLLGDAT